VDEEAAVAGREGSGRVVYRLRVSESRVDV
jgi:hypothetical protein